MMGTLLQDLRYGVRMLLKRPGFTLIAIVALALGVGANTAIFSVVNAVLLRPLPYPEPERLLTLGSLFRGDTEPGVLSYPNFADVRAQTQTLEQVVAYNRAAVTLTGGDEPQRLTGVVVSADLFPMMRVNPVLGRVFTRAEDQPQGPRLIVLSYGLWQRRFGSDPAIIGKDIALSGRNATVIGVMPAGFKFPLDADKVEYWMPFASDPGLAPFLENRDNHFLTAVARLRPGVTLQQARAELSTIAARLGQAAHPDSDNNPNFQVVPLQETLVGHARPALLVLLSAVGFVLLIACANVANLLLARAAARQREIALRTALGASRWRIVRQLLTESVLLALAGGVLGLLLALWGVDLLVAASPADLPRIQEINLDGRVLGFTLLVSLLTGLLFGLVPALQASRPDLNESLKESARGTSAGLYRNRVRSLLVVGEIALSLMLLVGAGLLLKSFERLRRVSPGFEPARALTLDVSPPRTKYGDADKQRAFYRNVFEQIRALPGVEAVGATSMLPFSGDNSLASFTIDGRPDPQPGHYPSGGARLVTPDYFRALGIPLRRGRSLAEQDGPQAPPVVIINEALAARYFAGEDAVGQRIKLGEENVPHEIVGIVGDIRHTSLDEHVAPEFYTSYWQEPQRSMTLVARTTGADAGTSGVAASLRNALRTVDRDVYLPEVAPMEQLISASVAQRRFSLTLLGVFAGVALLLAALGLYGVMAYSVTQRTHEIGIRLALGATARDVLRLVVGQGMALALVGVGVGLLGAFAATRVMTSLLYEVSASDPLTYAGIAFLLLLVAFVACYVPARRATKVDPMVALRYE